MASKFRPIFESLSEAAIRGARHADARLPQLTSNHSDQIDLFKGKIDGLDRYDGPGSNGSNGGPGSGDSDTPFQPSPSRRPGSMGDEEYRRLLEASVHNPDGDEAVLGKYYVPGTDSYVDVAEGRQPPATYFSLGDEWGDIRDAHGLTDPDMFEAFNVPFLERMMAEGKPISFSHNPLDFPDSALADELDFLRQNGYRFDPTTMQAVPR